MVETGLVDWAGHARDGALLGTEMIEGDRAVNAAWRFARDRTDTLILFTADHETGALGLSSETDVGGLNGQTASTEYMWGLIKEGAPIGPTVATYTGITDLTSAERATIKDCGETGISDILAARWDLSWGNWVCTDEGEHTLGPVPIWAWGPRSSDFAGTRYDNERVGQNLLAYLAP
jgi:alkaline phosphatase